MMHFKALYLILLIMLAGCSKPDNKNDFSQAPQQDTASKIDPQLLKIMQAIQATYSSALYKNKIQDGQIAIIYQISKNQSIELHSDANYKFSHLFVRQNGVQERKQAQTELLTTCKTIANNIDPSLPNAIEEMTKKANEYWEAGIAAQTATTQGNYHLMLDLSRFQVADCLIATRPVVTIIKSFSEPLLPTAITQEKAHDFAKKLYTKIEHDEAFIRDAFELGEYTTLGKYSYDFQNYTSIPYGKSEAAKDFGQRYFPENIVASPYVICDRAFNELNTLAFVMKNLIEEDTAFNRKNLRDKESLFMYSKNACHKRVNLTYQQAAKAYEKSDDL